MAKMKISGAKPNNPKDPLLACIANKCCMPIKPNHSSDRNIYLKVRPKAC
jgi:hypothetical protein